MKVIVTGCARSGTTIMIHLMRYFYSTKVVIEDEAHPFDYEKYNHKDHILVIKKPFVDLYNIQYFPLEDLLLKGWRVIWMIRDGRDVITSMVDDVFHVEPERWEFSNKSFLKNCMSKQILPVRYEDLVTDTEGQMLHIKKFIKQDYQDYSDWFNMVNVEDPMNHGIAPRPISADSIGNYRNHPERIVNLSADFNKLLTIFGYQN